MNTILSSNGTTNTGDIFKEENPRKSFHENLMPTPRGKHTHFTTAASNAI